MFIARDAETGAVPELLIGDLIQLDPRLDGILQLGHAQFAVQRADAFLNELSRVKLDAIDSLAVDPAPKLLKGPLVEIVIERVPLGLTPILELGERCIAVDAVDQAKDLCLVGHQIFMQRGQCPISLGCVVDIGDLVGIVDIRSEEKRSELQSLMRISYAVFCLKKKNTSLHNYNDLIICNTYYICSIH